MTNSTAKLQLITNDRFKKSLKANCKVQMFDTIDNFSEFVVVGNNGEKTQMHFDADPVLLGQAWLMTGKAFKESLEKLPQDAKDKLIELLAEG